MLNRKQRIPLLILLLSTAVPGCGWWGSDEDETTGKTPAIATRVESPTTTPASQQPKLGLHLKKGQRFPLMKTVEQRLTSETAGGPVTSRSKLELLLAITVEEVEPGRMLLGVRYHKVRYWHNIAGEEVVYDSRNLQQPVPFEAQVYRGLIDNGFSFWLGSDNRIIETVGFQAFLRRCVRGIPPEQHTQVLRTLAETTGDEGIANFIDDSIGLLPVEGDVMQQSAEIRVGSSWTRKRQIVQPTPMFLTSRCTLKVLNNEIAEIDIAGGIAPAAAFGPSDASGGIAQLVVTGGQTFGSCTIRRDTGLPVTSRVERYLDMVVTLPGGERVKQRKAIVTTIRAFPQLPSSMPAGGSTDSSRSAAADKPSSR